jgi:N-acetylneuraminic acid mutarotase
MHRFGIAGAVVVTTFLVQGAEQPPHGLTFEQRVLAQEAIERFYYAHQVGASRPFDEAVPRALLEKKVRTYLKQSAALVTFWNTRITGEALHRELERMAAGTRMPGRLGGLHAVLGSDPALIRECLARPALVDRLARNFFAYDATIHAQARREARTLHQDLLQGRIDPRAHRAGRAVVDLVRIGANDRAVAQDGRGAAPARPGGDPFRLELPPDEFDHLSARLPDRTGGIGAVEEEREAFVVRVVLERGQDRTKVATFTVPKQRWDDWWGSIEGRFDERSVEPAAPVDGPLPVPAPEGIGTASNPGCETANTWDNGSLDYASQPRKSHTAVWTGARMIVWGGFGIGGALDTGGRYDPLTDTWAPVATLNAPLPRYDHTAVWTGTEMIVWGGYYLDTGGRYDPASDTWNPEPIPTGTPGSPSPRWHHTAVWTGSRMIVWGGDAAGRVLTNTGGRYDPATNAWDRDETALMNAPAPRWLHTAVWDGSRMVVWGGIDGAASVATGGRYDPVLNAWEAMPEPVGLAGRYLHTAVWATGPGRMIVWGGDSGSGYLNDGGRYDPVMNAWDPDPDRMVTPNVPSPRVYHTAVWTGSRMIVWGGGANFGNLDPGGRYNPDDNSWEETTTVGAPSPRVLHTAVWADDVMIVWGGDLGPVVGQPLDTGGRYDPVADSWTPTSAPPEPREEHTAVWTGTHMIVWGGSGAGLLGTGGRYDPTMGAWTPTATLNAPAARRYHTAVWTGDRMVVWGGEATGLGLTNTGGRYNPVDDTWDPDPIPTATTGAPSIRASQTAVWAAGPRRMIVWGGFDGMPPSGYVGTGGRYDPSTNAWDPDPVSMVGAPSPRASHTAVWTGSRMIVWGGESGPRTRHDDGGRYDPTANTWDPIAMPTATAPSERSGHTAVWTGSRMIVWGGYSSGSFFENTGGRYDPYSNQWQPMAVADAPAGRFLHTAVWTGSRMVVWGGISNSTQFDDTGGRYDPYANIWDPVALSTSGAPSGRYRHTAVWTGGHMIVWGGQGTLAGFTGGRYDPGQDEICGDLTDNDCDGEVDEERPGVPEICNGLDDNCDGQVDEGSPQTGESCSTGLPGVCGPGTLQCDSDRGLARCVAITPARPEVCADGAGNGLDDDCDGQIDETQDLDGDAWLDCCSESPGCTDNCPEAFNPGQEDDDGDGYGDVCDCTPQVPGNQPPAQVDSLRMSRPPAGASILHWDPVPVATHYNVYRGYHTEGNAPGLNLQCLQAGVDAVQWADDLDPRLFTVFHYLVSSVCGGNNESGLGVSSSGQMRYRPPCPAATRDDDRDGTEQAADNCPGIANPSQSDADMDQHGDVCDNCPTVPNTDQDDANGNGIGDLCDDDDGDGIFNDGDGSGVIGDNPCRGGNNVACDDNCRDLPNFDQADDDNDGIGNTCER